MQHGEPPSALMARAIRSLPEAEGRVIGRITVEFLGAIPVAPLTVSAKVVRPGRSVVLVEATLVADRPVARASAWLPDAPSGLEDERCSVGLAPSDVYDELGLVARSAQVLLIVRR